MKDMTSVATTMMTDEEKAEVEKTLNEKGDGTPTPPIAGSQSNLPSASPPRASSPPSEPANGVPLRPAEPQHSSSLIPHETHSDTPSPTPNATKDKDLKEKEKEAARKRNKMTAEQKEKLREHEVARRKAMEARVAVLTTKLIERLRPFVEAKHPGDKDDPETLAFEKKMKKEAEDLKLESFGVEVSIQLP
jgi:hypothetical protein